MSCLSVLHGEFPWWLEMGNCCGQITSRNLSPITFYERLPFTPLPRAFIQFPTARLCTSDATAAQAILLTPFNALTLPADPGEQRTQPGGLGASAAFVVQG